MYEENAVNGRSLPFWPQERIAHAWRRFDNDDKFMVLLVLPASKLMI